tara:strand:+ start:2376 stop:2633 length:258 start_codon:yes stop_codon:yes gene_type:complete
MIYVLVGKDYDIVGKIDSVTPGGAKHYFMEKKRIYDEKKFDKLWKVITKKEYDLNQEAFQRKPSSHPGVIEWWKEEPTNPDIEYD